MKKRPLTSFLSRQWLRVTLFLVVFFLGVVLRLWKYPFYPFVGHAEEYLFVWSGLSLIEKGVPISWNDLPVYEEKHLFWQGVAPNYGPGGGGLGVRLLKPWLDEPPLFSLIVGGIAKFYQLPNFTVISSYVIRIPSLIFSFVTMAFVFLLARKFFGYWVGLLSLLVYSVIPTIVFGSRLAVPENMIAMLMAICLWLTVNYLETGKKWQRNLAVFLAGIAGLAKPTGYLLVPFVSFLVMEKRKWKEGLGMFLVGSLLFWLPFLTYGYHFDWELFKKVIAVQGARPAGWSSLTYIVTNPGFSVEVFLDGLMVLGFISLFFLAFKKNQSKGEKIIAFSFIYALLVAVISGGKHDQLTWYRYPIYPFLAISTALLIKEIIAEPSFLTSALFIPLVLANIDLLENPFWKLNFLIRSTPFRLGFFLLLVPSIFGLLSRGRGWKRLSRIVIIFSLSTGFFFSLWVVKSRFNVLCDHVSCILPQKIDLIKPILPKIK